MTPARLVARLVAAPNAGQRRKRPAGAGTRGIDQASDRPPDLAREGDATRRLTFGTAHAGGCGSARLGQRGGHRAPGAIQFTGIKLDPVGGTAGATGLAEIHKNNLAAHQPMAAIKALQGIVRIHAQTMPPAALNRKKRQGAN